MVFFKKVHLCDVGFLVVKNKGIQTSLNIPVIKENKLDQEGCFVHFNYLGGPWVPKTWNPQSLKSPESI